MDPRPTAAGGWGLKLTIGRCYLLLLPALTLAMLLMTYTVREPFPTLVMPGFAPAVSLDDISGFERSIFVIGDDGAAPSSVGALDFATIDFSQSRALPLIDGVRRELPDLDEELDDWIHERLASIVPDRCGEAVRLQREVVHLDGENRMLVVDEVIESYELGALRCTS